MTNHDHPPTPLTRRSLLGLGLGATAGLALSACGGSSGHSMSDMPGMPGTTGMTGPMSGSTSPTPSSARLRQLIAETEAARPHTGTVRTVTLAARKRQIDLGGRTVSTWTYADAVPGQLIRANVGDQLRVTVDNGLGTSTSVHWHGVALRNDMDGVAPMTPAIDTGGSFTYDFSVPHAGTYWYHPHVGVQLDYGLYGPLIVDDPNEKSWYDEEWVVLLDDWTDGVGTTPAKLYANLGGGMSGMSGMSGIPGMSSSGSMPGKHGVGSSTLLGGDAGDVAYPAYLVNGRLATAPTSHRTSPGRRIRIRLINAAADTAFRVALGGHRMSVTHTDGFPVAPVTVDALLLGMGERYDVVITAADGVFPLWAQAEGKDGHALAVLNTTVGGAAGAALRAPSELNGKVGQVGDFSAAGAARLATRSVDTSIPVVLGGDMMSYHWTINGHRYPRSVPLSVQPGQRAKVTFRNTTTMWHPMHLHGHTMQVIGTGGAVGARKDTVVVRPGATVSTLLDADNPGSWMLHCHNAYHAEAGMMTTLDYRV